MNSSEGLSCQADRGDSTALRHENSFALQIFLLQQQRLQ
jgi:hypothetical protein